MLTETQIDRAVRMHFDGLRFPERPAGLYDPLRHMLDSGGKRLRPRLCVTAWALYRDHIDEEILEPSEALELYHEFSLIHDDLMDNAPVRRGKPTVWKKWNASTAVLSGDVMMLEAVRRLLKVSPERLPSVMTLFLRTATEVCEGQQLDMDFESRERVTMEEYMEMIRCKTAVLLGCSARVGAMLAGAPESECELLYQYACLLGLAFQVADDYLDTFGDEAVFGKAIGGDILQGKKTWLLIRALAGAGRGDALRNALALPADTDARKETKIRSVTEIYRSLGVDALARQEIARLHGQALAKVEALRIGEARKELLRRFAAGLLHRVK